MCCAGQSFAAIINLLEFLYISGADWLIKKRFPFQDEYEDLTRVDRIMKLLPPRFRPPKNLEDYIGDIHKSARLVAELRSTFGDEEAQGEAAKETEVLKKEEAERKKKLRKEKWRVQKRMKARGYKGPGLDSLSASVSASAVGDRGGKKSGRKSKGKGKRGNGDEEESK